MESKTATVMAKAKKTALTCNLIPLESSSSLPIPVKLDGAVYLFVVYFMRNKANAGSTVKVHPPHSELLVTFPKGQIAYFRSSYLLNTNRKDFWKEAVGELNDIDIDKYRKDLQTIYHIYDKVIQLFQDDSSDDAFKIAFRAQFDTVCEPCLIPFLSGEFGKPFFRWLNSVSTAL